MLLFFVAVLVADVIRRGERLMCSYYPARRHELRSSPTFATKARPLLVNSPLRGDSDVGTDKFVGEYAQTLKKRQSFVGLAEYFPKKRV
jgi:hypothetical protein